MNTVNWEKSKTEMPKESLLQFDKSDINYKKNKKLAWEDSLFYSIKKNPKLYEY